MRFLIFVFILVYLLSCHKEPMPCEVPECNQDTIPAEDAMKLLWQFEINPNGNRTFADLYLKNENLIINNNFNSPVANIIYFDTTNKMVKWEWNEVNSEYYQTFTFDNNNIFIKELRGLYSIDIETGITNWSLVDTVVLNPRGALLGDYFYLCSWVNTPVSLSIANFRRVNKNEGQAWETLLTFDKVNFDNFSTVFESPNLWMHPNTNDSILIIPVRMVEFDRNLRRSDLIAYNLNTKEIMWQVENFTPIVNIDQPLIHNGHVYVRNSSEIYAFNLLDGSLIWSFKETSQWVNYDRATLQIIDNKLITVDENGTVVFALDPLSGQTIWRHDEVFEFASGENGIVVYKNYIITGSFNKLDVFDVRDGKHVYKIRNTVRRFRGRMALDEANRKLYVPEESQIVCYELPEEF